MNESAKLLEPGFSVADAEYPTINLRDGTLILGFIDWHENAIEVKFANVAGVMWQETDSAGPENRDDSVFEIIGSSWLNEYLIQGARTLNDSLHHYRLCFNANGVLDVLAASMSLEHSS
jgi:hypothetical protein